MATPKYYNPNSFLVSKRTNLTKVLGVGGAWIRCEPTNLFGPDAGGPGWKGFSGVPSSSR